MFLGKRPYVVKGELNTPFGAVRVRVNGNYMPFRYCTSTYEVHEKAPIVIHMIEVDVSNLHTDDKIFCGLEDDLLEYDDGDENCILYTCENDELMFGIGAFEPYDFDTDWCCFELEKCTAKGYYYRVTYEPADLKRPDIYSSSRISLSIAWIEKSLYEDPDTLLCLALL